MINSETSEAFPNPTWRFVFKHPAHIVAFSGGLGLSPIAPGTGGTLLAIPLYWLISSQLEAIPFLLIIAACFALGIWACDKTGKDLGVADYGGIVWDETVAFLLVLVFVPTTQLWQAIAFLIFRFFDIVKPQPIRCFDRRFKNGFGVMFDDLLAAFFTLLCIAAMKVVDVDFGGF